MEQAPQAATQTDAAPVKASPGDINAQGSATSQGGGVEAVEAGFTLHPAIKPMRGIAWPQAGKDAT